MALLQRQPINLSQSLPYTISFSKAALLIVGLGNPGKDYTLTRHNIGFMTLDSFAQANQFEGWQDSAKFKGSLSERVLGSTRVILLKPNTFMNLSGDAARLAASFYKIDVSKIIAVYDEISIPFGHIRTRTGGQSAGHNGVKSLIEQLGADFGRVRIGTKNALSKNADQSDFVLGRFSASEQQKLPDIINEAGSILTEFIFSGKLNEETRRIEVIS